jgi:hypothetical protein
MGILINILLMEMLKTTQTRLEFFFLKNLSQGILGIFIEIPECAVEVKKEMTLRGRHN